MSPGLWLAVAVLGGLGAVARLVVDGLVSGRTRGGFPWGTLAVNVSGAFALGLLAGLSVGGDAQLLAGGAVLGAYTTFSTWMLESHRLGQDGERRGMLLNLAVSLAAGLGAAEAGRLLGGLG